MKLFKNMNVLNLLVGVALVVLVYLLINKFRRVEGFLGFDDNGDNHNHNNNNNDNDHNHNNENGNGNGNGNENGNENGNGHSRVINLLQRAQRANRKNIQHIFSGVTALADVQKEVTRNGEGQLAIDVQNTINSAIQILQGGEQGEEGVLGGGHHFF